MSSPNCWLVVMSILSFFGFVHATITHLFYPAFYSSKISVHKQPPVWICIKQHKCSYIFTPRFMTKVAQNLIRVLHLHFGSVQLHLWEIGHDYLNFVYDTSSRWDVVYSIRPVCIELRAQKSSLGHTTMLLTTRVETEPRELFFEATESAVALGAEFR